VPNLSQSNLSRRRNFYAKNSFYYIIGGYRVLT
jgi:hypothetical protein